MRRFKTLFTCAIITALLAVNGSYVKGDASFRRGDANIDKKVDISDSIFILLYLFDGNLTLSCEKSSDANDDGTLTIADPIFILNLLGA